MSKGKKRCYFCRCDLTNQNRNTTTTRTSARYEWNWVDCCHSCKAKEAKKP